jgi:hypothetical protein
MTTPGSSTSHLDEWVNDYRARMMSAINRRPKPEGIDEPEDAEIIICPVPD